MFGTRFASSIPRSARRRRAGFTLVEIMIVVMILGLVGALAMPNYFRARKRAQASRILDDLQMIDAAMEQYSIENHRADGDPMEWQDITPYFKTNSKLATAQGKDLLGNDLVGFQTGKLPAISDATFDALSEVTPEGFWSPYR